MAGVLEDSPGKALESLQDEDPDDIMEISSSELSDIDAFEKTVDIEKHQDTVALDGDQDSVSVGVPNHRHDEIVEAKEVSDLNYVEIIKSNDSVTVAGRDMSSSSSDDDVASKAAVALAAVAAAATANNKSPAEAGREARDLAQSFIRTAVSVETTSTTSEFTDISLSAVKSHLRQKAQVSGSHLMDRLLCRGENDAFLQHLLLLEYYRCHDDPIEKDQEEDLASNHTSDETRNTTSVVVTACEKLESLIKRIELSYDCLVGMLPHVSSHQNRGKSSGGSLKTEQSMIKEADIIDEDDRPAIIPDLLPSCTTAQGDATVLFFRACLGENSDVSTGRQSTLSSEHNTGSNSVQSHATATTKSSDDAGDASTSKDSYIASKTTEQASPLSPPRQVAVGGVFSSMFKRNSSKSKQPEITNNNSLVASLGSTGISNVFRKKKSIRQIEVEDSGQNSFSKDSERGLDSGYHSGLRPGEYIVKIEREMLGLTVENVLERTVVRTVVAGGPAKKAGAKVGSLIVKVGNVETKNLTHFETIDELRQSNRPLQLVMRELSEDALRLAREEMGRLIKGLGYGTILDSYNSTTRYAVNAETSGSSEGDGASGESDNLSENQKAVRPLIGADLRIDAYTSMLRRRFSETAPQPKNKKEEALARVGEKLVWILTLFVVGLEREASLLMRQSSRQNLHHSSKDYQDASKSVSKVLYDYARKTIDPKASNNQKTRSSSYIQHSLSAKGTSTQPPPPPPRNARNSRRQISVPGVSLNDDSSMIHEKPLLQIGDVLQRTRSFLADTSSPPSALLRGEIICLLCDVLDIDTDMELSEEEAISATAGASASAINDLGSAGTLLKLIVLNCNLMRSPSCDDESLRRGKLEAEMEDELKRRFGPKGEINTLDLHKLHAGNRFLAVVHRLAASRSTSARVTACSLGPILWGHLDFPHQLQLRGVITRALHDVEVIVRKSTATVLHEIAELVFDKRSVPWLVLMCERAMTDPEPQLRSAAMTLTWHLGEHLPNAFLGDASQGSRYLRRLPSRDDPLFADVYLLQCKLLPVATRLAEDRSPSVRLAVAAQCDRLCESLGDHWSSVIIDVLHGLINDADERVRCEAVSCVPRISEIVLLSASPGETAVSEVSILESLFPASIKLQKDQSISVRVALATAAGELLTLLVAMQSRATDFLSLSNHDTYHNRPAVLERRQEADSGKRYKSHVDDRLIPLVQTLLNDSDPEVTSAALRAVTNATRSSVQHSRVRRMSVTSDDDASFSSYQSHTSTREKPVFLPVLSENQVLRLLPTLTELADSRQWRVRQSAVEIVPALLGCTHQLETRTEISKLCVRLMSDQVDAVRKTAAECLCMGGTSLGSHGEDAAGEWISSIVIPNIRKCAVDGTSKQRLLSLKMIEIILLNGVCPSKWYSSHDNLTDTPMRDLVAIALSLTNDRIANVRLNVGRVLETVLHVFEEQEILFIKEVLANQIDVESDMEGGGDRDVIYFATLCLNRAKALGNDRALNSQDSMPDL